MNWKYILATNILNSYIKIVLYQAKMVYSTVTRKQRKEKLELGINT